MDRFTEIQEVDHSTPGVLNPVGKQTVFLGRIGFDG